jgi:hypothetical protein
VHSQSRILQSLGPASPSDLIALFDQKTKQTKGDADRHKKLCTLFCEWLFFLCCWYGYAMPSQKHPYSVLPTYTLLGPADQFAHKLTQRIVMSVFSHIVVLSLSPSHVVRPLLLRLLLPILLVFFSYSCPLLLLLPILLLLLLLLLLFFFSFSAAPPPPPPLLLLVFCCSSNIKLIACRSSPNGRHCHRWTAASVSSSSSGVCSTCSWEPCLAAPSLVNWLNPSKTQVTNTYKLS